METLDIYLGAEKYDRRLKVAVPEMGDLAAYVKKQEDGVICCMFSFTAVVDGQPVKVQAVTTGKLIINLANVLSIL